MMMVTSIMNTIHTNNIKFHHTWLVTKPYTYSRPHTRLHSITYTVNWKILVLKIFC